jgi:hypothetical protein
VNCSINILSNCNLWEINPWCNPKVNLTIQLFSFLKFLSKMFLRIFDNCWPQWLPLKWMPLDHSKSRRPLGLIAMRATLMSKISPFLPIFRPFWFYFRPLLPPVEHFTIFDLDNFKLALVIALLFHKDIFITTKHLNTKLFFIILVYIAQCFGLIGIPHVHLNQGPIL